MRFRGGYDPATDCKSCLPGYGLAVGGGCAPLGGKQVTVTAVLEALGGSIALPAGFNATSLGAALGSLLGLQPGQLSIAVALEGGGGVRITVVIADPLRPAATVLCGAPPPPFTRPQRARRLLGH